MCLALPTTTKGDMIDTSLGKRKVTAVNGPRFFISLRQADVERIYRQLAYLVRKEGDGRGKVEQRGNTVVMDTAAFDVLEQLHGDIDGHIRNGTMWIGESAYEVQKAIL